jgi:hypothetical protein
MLLSWNFSEGTESNHENPYPRYGRPGDRRQSADHYNVMLDLQLEQRREMMLVIMLTIEEHPPRNVSHSFLM